MGRNGAESELRKLQLPQDVEGRVYLNSMPGRNEPLAKVISEMAKEAINKVISLASDSEISKKSPELAEALRKDWFPVKRVSFPIDDFGVPSNPIEFLALVQEVAADLRAGKRILIHCGAGIGRTGTLAASILLALGQTEDQSLEAVKLAGSQPETREQGELVHWVASNFL
jgi:protein-tyrosine phosphatase